MSYIEFMMFAFRLGTSLVFTGVWLGALWLVWTL